MNRNHHIVTLAVAAVLAVAGTVASAEDQATKLSDEQITQNVKQKLASDDSTVAPRIIVSTHDGVVTLMGFELTPGNIKAAVADANATDGVVRVENRLSRG
jgi:osmotically-inducible protein OsmY